MRAETAVRGKAVPCGAECSIWNVAATNRSMTSTYRIRRIWCDRCIKACHAPSQVSASRAAAASVSKGRSGEQHRVIVNVVAEFQSGSSDVPYPSRSDALCS
jgi:hypothetical protein